VTYYGRQRIPEPARPASYADQERQRRQARIDELLAKGGRLTDWEQGELAALGRCAWTPQRRARVRDAEAALLERKATRKRAGEKPLTMADVRRELRKRVLDAEVD